MFRTNSINFSWFRMIPSDAGLQCEEDIDDASCYGAKHLGSEEPSGFCASRIRQLELARRQEPKYFMVTATCILCWYSHWVPHFGSPDQKYRTKMDFTLASICLLWLLKHKNVVGSHVCIIYCTPRCKQKNFHEFWQHSNEIDRGESMHTF